NRSSTCRAESRALSIADDAPSAGAEAVRAAGPSTSSRHAAPPRDAVRFMCSRAWVPARALLRTQHGPPPRAAASQVLVPCMAQEHAGGGPPVGNGPDARARTDLIRVRPRENDIGSSRPATQFHICSAVQEWKSVLTRRVFCYGPSSDNRV